MSVLTTLLLSQDAETPTVQVTRDHFSYSYAYARSSDSRQAGDSGQDLLTLREQGGRVAFVVCDGVSQSFMGDLAARVLGTALLEWFWGLSPEQTTRTHIADELVETLTNLVGVASAKVEAYPLAETISPLVREVLEQKRAIGSESTFVAGLVDLEQDILALAWMGDSRLRLWDTTDTPFDLGNTFHTMERWSSRRGLVGTLHTRSVSARTVSRILIYSDGLARLDSEQCPSVAPTDMDATIQLAYNSATSDDISLFDLRLHPAYGGEAVDNTPYKQNLMSDQSRVEPPSIASQAEDRASELLAAPQVAPTDVAHLEQLLMGSPDRPPPITRPLNSLLIAIRAHISAHTRSWILILIFGLVLLMLMVFQLIQTFLR